MRWAIGLCFLSMLLLAPRAARLQEDEDEGPPEDEVEGSLLDSLRQMLWFPDWQTTPRPDFTLEPGQGWPEEVSQPFEHGEWETILCRYVTEDGLFEYDRLRQQEEDLALLNTYLDRLGEANLASLPPAELLAFWINAYNACTVQGVLVWNPQDSVLEVEGFFDERYCRIAGASISLNEIENHRIRQMFGEPRVHFALNAAARGCPPLRQEAYRGYHLDDQLEEQAHRFIRATTRVDTNRMEVQLSRLLEWFGRDFEGVGGVREFVAQRLDRRAAEWVRLDSYMLVFTAFDWGLNDAP